MCKCCCKHSCCDSVNHYDKNNPPFRVGDSVYVLDGLMCLNTLRFVQEIKNGKRCQVNTVEKIEWHNSNGNWIVTLACGEYMGSGHLKLVSRCCHSHCCCVKVHPCCCKEEVKVKEWANRGDYIMMGDRVEKCLGVDYRDTAPIYYLECHEAIANLLFENGTAKRIKSFNFADKPYE